jgi:YD repeat-containing protein
LLTLTDGRNLVTSWNYDAYGRVTNKLDQTGTEIFRYTYDAKGRLVNRWTPAMGDAAYSYDAVGNLTYVEYLFTITPSIGFGYNLLNRLTNMVDAVGTTGFEYHPGGGLAKENGPWSSDTVANGYVRGLRYALGLQPPPAGGPTASCMTSPGASPTSPPPPARSATRWEGRIPPRP